ncbi:MAG: hypothetical protein H8D45_07910 [Bacteroidetes bacterium]|nr:hypothetical protein [Bacteroidota bacterium]
MAFTEVQIYSIIRTNLSKSDDTIRFTNDMIFLSLMQAHEQIESLVIDTIKNGASLTVETSGSGYDSFAIYLDIVQAYIDYATYNLKLIDKEFQEGAEFWYKKFYQTISDANKRYFIDDSQNFGVENMSDSDYLYMRIGINLNEAITNGLRYSRGMKYEWMREAHFQLNNMLSESVKEQTILLPLPFVLVFNLTVQMNLYNVANLNPYVFYATYLGKTLEKDYDAAKMWLERFYQSVNEINTRLFAIDITDTGAKTENGLYFAIGVALDEPMIESTRFTKGMKFTWIRSANDKIISLVNAIVISSSSFITTNISFGHSIIGIYDILWNAYIYYATHEGKLLSRDFDGAKIALEKFYTEIEEVDKKYYRCDTFSGVSETGEIENMTQLLTEIGSLLGEPMLNGTRFSATEKLRFLAIASDKISTLLTTGIQINTKKEFYIATVNGTNEYLIESSIFDIDYIYGIHIKYDSDGIERLATKVTQEEYDTIYEEYNDSETDFDADSYFASDEDPIYCIYKSKDSTGGLSLTTPDAVYDPLINEYKFYIKVLPVPDENIDYGILISIHKLPSLPEFVVSQVGDVLDSHRKLILAHIQYSVCLGKMRENNHKSAREWERVFYNSINELNRKYRKLNKGRYMSVVVPQQLN